MHYQSNTAAALQFPYAVMSSEELTALYREAPCAILFLFPGRRRGARLYPLAAGFPVAPERGFPFTFR